MIGKVTLEDLVIENITLDDLLKESPEFRGHYALIETYLDEVESGVYTLREELESAVVLATFRAVDTTQRLVMLTEGIASAAEALAGCLPDVAYEIKRVRNNWLF